MAGTALPTAAAPGDPVAPSAGIPGPAALLAGAMSVGAGLVHAAAIGPHADTGVLRWMFVAAAVAQCAAGLALLALPSRWAAAAVVVVNVGCLATWVASRTVGIGFVEALEEVEPVGLADGLAAAMAALAVVGAAMVLRRPVARTAPSFASVAAVPIVVAAALLTVPALAASGSHALSESTEGGHSHGRGTDVVTDELDDSHADDHVDHGDGSGSAPTTAAPKPFDPSAPIDLSGTPGVTPEQQAWAEELLARTLERLPQWEDPAVAEAAGYRSIGDGYTGHEHFLLWDSINDERWFDPDQPESLVYSTAGGGRKLVAAMYMLPDTFTLETVPDLGGALIQYHVHDDLCFSTGDAPQVVGITSVGGECSYGVKFRPAPMFHVWITPHRCGPFAALEGVAGGQVRPGETPRCDHVHGSGSF